MKPFSAKSRKDVPDPMQMDFLSAIPAPQAPMAPLEPGPDGTPPLPLTNPTEPVPDRAVFPDIAGNPEGQQAEERTTMTEKQDDVFESDPFFNPNPEAPGEDVNDEIPFESDEIPPEDVPSIITEPEAVPPVATAEERLLSTIVGEEPVPEPAGTTPVVADTGEVDAIKADLEAALADRAEALSARDRARQDLQVLKTRFSTLEADLADARKEAGKANQARLQAETRLTEAEKQWTDKLSQMRRMLDEVEVLRDELISKRVPKILYMGTLAAGILATTFAYFIGANLSRSRETPPAIAAPPAPPVAAEKPLTVPAMTTVRPPRQDSTPPAATPQWPSLKNERWAITQSDREMTVVFNQGTFAQGTGLSSLAKQDLKAIATAVQAAGARFMIEAEGHTDSTQVKKTKTTGANNQALGLARAKVAAAYLVKYGGLPASQVTASSAGEANPPFPNTTEASRKKNRTVVLKIRPTAGSAQSP